VATVEVVGILRDYVKHRVDEIGPMEGLAIAAVIQKLGLPTDLVAFVMVNGHQKPKTYVIEPGDTVKLIPFVGGG
jgi:sulfur carrier protein ThiS